MLSFIRDLYERWHNSTLLTIYRILDNYACSERVRTMVSRTIIWSMVTILSLLLYFALTHWLPASKKILDFTAEDTRRPVEENMPGAQVTTAPANPIPVEEDIQY